MPEDLTASEFTRLLDYLKTSRDFDFGAYKVSSLMRRIQKRMREVGLQGYAEYIEFLEVHPHEFGPLFDTVLINVTGFFRDAPSWSCLAEKILPRILESQDPERPLRQDLCHRRRRGRAGHRTPGELRGAPDRRSASGAARQVFRDERHPLRLPRRPAAVPDLRPPRPHPGCRHLAPRPPGLPQHPDVFQFRDPGEDPGALPFRAQQERLPVPGQGRDEDGRG